MNIPGIWNALSAEARVPPQEHSQKSPQHGVVRTRPQSEQIASSAEPYYLPYFNYSNNGRFTPSVPPPPSSPPPVADAFTALFDSTLDRFQQELANLRDVCNDAFLKEQQQTKRWKRHCDIARDKVKKLTRERMEWKASLSRDDDDSNCGSSSEHRGHSPIPTISRAKRGSTFSRRSSSSSSSLPSHSDTENPPLSSSPSSKTSSLRQKRRSWDSSSSTSPALRSTLSPLSPNGGPDFHSFPEDPFTQAHHHHPANILPLLPPPLLLPPAELPPLKRSHSAGPVLMSNGVYCEANFVSCGGEGEEGIDSVRLPAIGATRNRTPPRMSGNRNVEADRTSLLRNLRGPKRVGLKTEHIDILYTYVNGEYYCQACRINQLKASRTPASPSQQHESPQHQHQHQHELNPVATFPASQTHPIDLLDHYLSAHPKEAREVASLRDSNVTEVKRQLRSREERRRQSNRAYVSCPSSPSGGC